MCLKIRRKTILKGVNVPKALIQIKETLVLYKNVFRKFGHVYARAIVTSSTPNLKASPEYVNPEFPKISGSTLNSGSTLTPKKL